MKKLSKSFVAVIVLILVLVVGSSSIVSTYNDEYKLVYTQVLEEYIDKKRKGELV